MSVMVAITIGVVLAIAGTIVASIMITPESKREGLNKYLQIVHDIFNFKSLLLEKIIKVLYIFCTLFCIAGGFFMLFSGVRGLSGSFRSMALSGIVLMIVGPIIIRITFEYMMMFILLVKNTMEINNKIPGGIKKANTQNSAPEAPAPKMVYCSKCGTKYNAELGACPKGCDKKPEEPKTEKPDAE